MNADLNVNTAGLHAVKGRLFAGEDRDVPSRATVRLSEILLTQLKPGEKVKFPH
jgi:hypothetical protein